MIIISQDGYEQINFDNVKRLILDDSYISGTNIFVEFTDGTTSTIGTFKEAEYGKEVFQDLLLDYRGNSVIEVPQDKKNRPVGCRSGNVKNINLL